MPDQPLSVTGFDAALIGVAFRCGQMPLLVYDTALIIAELERQGMSPEEAEEYATFNIVEAWCGPGTPLMLVRVSGMDEAQALIED